MNDIRWIQRYNNFTKALNQLTVFMEKAYALNPLEKQGLIQAFEYNYELAWNVIKDFYEYQGETTIQGSRDAFRMAYNKGLITNGKAWLLMIESRVKTSHTYNEDTAEEIIQLIINDYYTMFLELHEALKKQINKYKFDDNYILN